MKAIKTKTLVGPTKVHADMATQKWVDEGWVVVGAPHFTTDLDNNETWYQKIVIPKTYECGFRSDQLEPCETCPRKITAVHSCGILQDSLEEQNETD